MRRDAFQVYFVSEGEGLFIALASLGKVLGRQARLWATMATPAIRQIERRECVPYAVLIEFAPSEDQERLRQLGEEFIVAARQSLAPTEKSAQAEATR